MKKIRLKNGFNSTFIHKKIPRLIVKLISEALKNPINLPALKWLKKEYQIKFSELINSIQENLQISEDVVSIIIEINPIALIKPGVKLITVLDFINAGNLEIHGTNAINNIFNYVQNNIATLYKLYIMKKGGKIWG